jgi:bifunctional non-homologous end joining protein LigD
MAKVDVTSGVFDGEVCAVDDEGRTRFQDLQAALGSGKTGGLVYFVFDLLFVDGEDLRDQPLAERKARLATVLGKAKPPLAYVGHLEDPDEAHAVFTEGCKRGLEGLIAKRLDRPYRSGRSTDWLKIKCRNEEEFVIVGFTPPSGARTGIGALLLGAHAKGAKGGTAPLTYAGKVGTGFNAVTLKMLGERLGKLAVDAPAVQGAPKMRDVTWVAPSLVCQVAFTEWTREGSLRHPSYLGLREDKDAHEVTPEVRPARAHAEHAHAAHAHAAHAHTGRAHDVQSKGKVMVEGVGVSHHDRVIDDVTGTTKLDLAHYFAAMEARILPYAAGRPLAVVRAPEGIGKETFFQKKKYPGMPRAIHAAHAAGFDIIHIADVEGLVSLAQFGVIELHGWGAKVPAPEKPDWIVMDLDPDEGLPFARVADAAVELRAILRALGLESFVKTTGGKGLHVVAPFEPEYDWNAVKTLTQSIATGLEATAPARFTANMAKKHRVGRIFVDYLRNGEGQTAILPYSPRTRPGLGVAMPIAWSEVHTVDPRAFDVRTVPAIVAKQKTDPWADFWTLEQRLPPKLGSLVASLAARPKSDG